MKRHCSRDGQAESHWQAKVLLKRACLRLAAMRPAVTHASSDSASRAIAPKNSVVDVSAMAIDRNLRDTQQTSC